MRKWDKHLPSWTPDPKKMPMAIGKPMMKNIPSQSRLISRKSFTAIVRMLRISLANSVR